MLEFLKLNVFRLCLWFRDLNQSVLSFVYSVNINSPCVFLSFTRIAIIASNMLFYGGITAVCGGLRLASTSLPTACTPACRVTTTFFLCLQR